MVLFERTSHPEYSEERQISALRLLDSTIRALNLAVTDLDNPNSSVSPQGIATLLPNKSYSQMVAAKVNFETLQLFLGNLVFYCLV